MAIALAATAEREPLFPTPLFFAAIVISTWYGGSVPGLVTVALATVVLDYYFIPPAGTLALDKPRLAYLIEFVLPALLTCHFVQKRKITEATLLKTRDELTSQVEERQAELARVSRMLSVGEMGVSIAHEVNQPLMAVVLHGDACLQWLGASPPNLEQARQSVSRIIAEGTRAAETVRRMRALGTKSGHHYGIVDLNELVIESLAMLDRSVVKSKTILRTDLAEGLPGVQGDRVQLQQVIFNLVTNAIEAMSEDERGPRDLRIKSERDGAGGVAVGVADSGPGLPAGDPDQLFQAFFTTKPKGLGIGLSISRSIIEAHGGRLWATSLSRGALFQFCLPAEEGAAQ